MYLFISFTIDTTINETSIDPYAWQYTDPIKTYFQLIVANNNPIKFFERNIATLFLWLLKRLL